MLNLDALEDILKARKAKGLSAWKKFEKVQQDLAGKSISDITFTTCYPGHEGQTKQLGSLSGNLHFLLGYVSPAFYLAPYHWRLVDMNLDANEISKKKHPANPKYWKESGLELEPEGDLVKGKPSPAVRASSRLKAKAAGKKKGTKTISSGYGTFVVDLDENVVFSKESGYVYSLDVVKNSFLYDEHLDILEAKASEESEAASEETSKSLKLAPFSNKVYPVLAKALPYPGSIVRFDEFSLLVTPTKIHFVDRNNKPIEVRVFDRVYKSFDLCKDGDTHPSILLQFVQTYLGDVGAAGIVLDTLDEAKAVQVGGDSSGRSVVYADGHYAVR